MLEQMLQRLVDLPLSDTIPLEDAEFFFTQVFAAVCQKIIRSRFFKYQSNDAGTTKCCMPQTTYSS